ncbi:HEPN domain-containing protein [Rickettsiales bacterium]|nr:HEPN domain-containing protein [Rickettsiales bacterium]
MKESLKYLPKIKQDELKTVVDIINNNCDEVEKVILFGSYARGDYKEEKDLIKEKKEKKKLGRVSTAHISDYDILVVTKTKEGALNHSLWGNIKDKELKSLKFSADPRIITHDINELNNKLEEGQYFFSDIKKEGILLFDKKNSELSEEKDHEKDEIKRIAQKNFDEWFNSANDFFKLYQLSLKENTKSFLKKAAFNLHQAAETSLKTITLVFSNYCPNEHYLQWIQNDIEDYYPEIMNFFKTNNEEDKRRVLLLEYAYIGGRYDNDFYISKEDLEILEKDVKKLIETTKIICKKEIEK